MMSTILKSTAYATTPVGNALCICSVNLPSSDAKLGRPLEDAGEIGPGSRPFIGNRLERGELLLMGSHLIRRRSLGILPHSCEVRRF
jgi:hypothetical protein